MTRLFVSKRRSRAANDYSRVIPAQAGIQSLFFVSKRRSQAANEYSRAIPAQAGIQCLSQGCGGRQSDQEAGFPLARERHESGCRA